MFQFKGWSVQPKNNPFTIAPVLHSVVMTRNKTVEEDSEKVLFQTPVRHAEMVQCLR